MNGNNGNNGNRVSFNPNQASPRQTRSSTSTQSPGVTSSGWALPGTDNPKGSYNSATGQFTGDYRNIGVGKPWGGKYRRSRKISKRNNKISRKRSRKSNRRR